MKRAIWVFILLMLTMVSIQAIMSEEVKMDRTADKKKVFTLSDVLEPSIKVDAGEVFFIRLKSNITTGYSWEFAHPVDKNYLEFLGKIDEEEQEANSRKETLLGAPGFEILKLKSLAPGLTVIELKLVRPWEKDVPPVKSHHIHVTID